MSSAAMPSASDALIAGFGLATRRPHFILIDMIAKLAWMIGSGLILGGFSLWFLSRIPIDESDLVWFQSGVPGATLLGFLSSIRTNLSPLVWMLVLSSGVSLLWWTALEASVRGGILPLTGNSLIRDATLNFTRFLLTGLIRRSILVTIAILVGLVSFGPLLTTPMTQWPSVWPDVRWAAVAGAVVIALVAFFLTILDTLIRCNALELLGRSLSGVLLVIGVPAVMELGFWAFAASLAFIAVMTPTAPGVVIALTGFLIVALSVVHSYLLLARYSAVGIMRLDS